MWEREEEYKAELEQVIQKAGTTRLERLAYLALEDERTCYKHVLVLLEKQYRKCGPNMRGKLHLLYCVSTLLRQSRKQQGARDRYAERLQPLTSALIVDLRLEFSAQVDKLLKLWRMEGVFSQEQFLEVESGRAAVALRQPSLQSKSPSGSLTEASAQDPHVGLGDASGSGRSSAIQSYPRFAGGRPQAAIPGSVPSYQQLPLPEGQDPYSADSNPNGARGGPPPPSVLPPPPPLPLIPPGLLGPVGPPGILPQGSAAAAAAAAVAAAGLFPQGQLGSFLGTAPAALMQQGAFITTLGPFGAGSIGNGLPGTMGGAMGPGMGVGVGGVLAGGMGSGLPFQGGPGAMPPGLGLPRPPLYPQPPVYGSHSQGQNQGGRGLNRFSQANGRTPPNNGPGPATSHGQGQGWQGRFGQDGQGSASQLLPPPPPPPPPRPPPGSPPHGTDSRVNSTAAAAATSIATAVPASAPSAHNILRVNGGIDTSGLKMPPGLGPAIATCPDAAGGSSSSSTQKAAPTGYVRPSGRRSRWELERDSSEVEAAAATADATERAVAGAGPVPKRPALAVEGGTPAQAPDSAAEAKPSLPGPSALPPSTQSAAPSGADAATVPGLQQPASPALCTAADAHAESAGGVELRLQRQELYQSQQVQLQSDPGLQELHLVEEQTRCLADTAATDASSTPMDASAADGQASGQGAEDVAVADGKADPDGAAETDERMTREAVAMLGRKHEEPGTPSVAADVGALGVIATQPQAPDVPVDTMEVDDGGSSSAEAVCPAAQHQDSTAPASPGRLSGAAEQGESRDRRAGEEKELRQDEQRRQEEQQEQRQSSSSGAGESGCDGLSAVAPDSRDATIGVEQEQRELLQREQGAEDAKAPEAGMSTNRASSGEQGDAQQRAHHDVQSAEHQPTLLPGEETEEQLPAEQLAEQPGAKPDAQPPAAQPATRDPDEGGGQQLEGARDVAAESPGVAQGAACADMTETLQPQPAAGVAAAEPDAAGPAETHASLQSVEEIQTSDGATLSQGTVVVDAADTDAAANPAALVSPAVDAAAVATAPTAPASDPAPPVRPEGVEGQPSEPAPGPQHQSQHLQHSQQPQQQMALHSSTTLLMSYVDSRVPLQLEELELGDLDESWLE